MQIDISKEALETQNFGNTKEVENNKQEYRKKVERFIWGTVPTKQLYVRQNVESELLTLAN